MHYFTREIMGSLLIRTIIVGITGTTAMTAFLYLSAYVFKKRLKVIPVLGTMLTNRTTRAKRLSSGWSVLLSGTLAHYIVGIGFSFIYILLWEKGIGKPITRDSLAFGFINGMFAALVWWVFIRIHPNPPYLPVISYLLFIFLGHLVFALGNRWVYDCLFL
jgi:uncharacterized membrane protein YagU involved in acid resistance